MSLTISFLFILSFSINVWISINYIPVYSNKITLKYREFELIPMQSTVFNPVDAVFPFIFGEQTIHHHLDPANKIFNSIRSNQLSYDLNASLRRPRYFVFPNIKGLGNRLLLLTGIYILSSYHRIPIIRK